MVYKISGDFTDENLPIFIDKIKEKYNIIYQNGILYIALKSYSQYISFDDKNDISTIQSPYNLSKQLKQELQQNIFLPIGDFWIKDLFSQNNFKETAFVQKWLEDNLVRLDIERLEIEKQIELKETFNSLEEIEKVLDNKIRELFHKDTNNNEKKEISKNDNG